MRGERNKPCDVKLVPAKAVLATVAVLTATISCPLGDLAFGQDVSDRKRHTLESVVVFHPATPEVETLEELSEGDYAEHVKKIDSQHYFSVRIPGFILTSNGTVVATCAQRIGGIQDSQLDCGILLSRSLDLGKTWEPQREILREPGVTFWQGAIVEDRETGTLLLPYVRFPATQHWSEFYVEEGRKGGGFWMIQSKDDGQNWSPPAWIEVQRNPSGWTGFPDNAVHGIQLSAGQHAGRLVIPAKVFKQGERGFLTGICGGLLTSDDRGRTWTVGAVLQPGSDESVIAETSGGGVSVNYRYNKWFNEKRGFGHSVDGGATIQDFGNHEDLVTPTCHAGLVRVPDWDDQGDALLFSHPGYPRAGRNDMSVYLSCDQGHTWFYTQLIHEGPSAYSDLLLAPDGSILCLFENAPRRFSDYGNNALFWGQISVTRFDRAWLTENLRTVRASLPKEDDESEKVSGTFFKKVPDTFFLKTHTNEI